MVTVDTVCMTVCEVTDEVSMARLSRITLTVGATQNSVGNAFAW